MSIEMVEDCRFTIAGVHRLMRNPDQPWTPELPPTPIAAPDLSQFVVTAVAVNETIL